MESTGAASALGRIEGLLQAEDHAGAASVAEKALGDLSVLSRVAALRGKALLDLCCKR
jgi:hypothetical protein